MSTIRKALTALGAIFLVALLLAALAPKAARGFAAAIVQVGNTTANPAITSNMDDPGRIPYQATVDGNSGSNCTATVCQFNFAPVPAGHRLVILHVSAFIQANPNSTPMRVGVGAHSSFSSTFLVTVQDTLSGLNEIQFDQPVLVYVDAGQTPVVVVNSNIVTFLADTGQVVTLTGYLLDCNAAPCSAIVSN